MIFFLHGFYFLVSHELALYCMACSQFFWELFFYFASGICIFLFDTIWVYFSSSWWRDAQGLMGTFWWYSVYFVIRVDDDAFHYCFHNETLGLQCVIISHSSLFIIGGFFTFLFHDFFFFSLWTLGERTPAWAFFVEGWCCCIEALEATFVTINFFFFPFFSFV